jgi:hypothetical protein
LEDKIIKVQALECPLCHSSETVFKVSQVYLAGITDPKSRTAADRMVVETVFGQPDLATRDLREGLRPFLPPSGKSQVMRPLHPDLVMGVFGLVALVMLYNIFVTEPQDCWVAALVFLAFGGAYLAARRQVMIRFEKAQLAVREEKAAVEGLVGRWLKLYLCSEDGTVFELEE